MPALEHFDFSIAAAPQLSDEDIDVLGRWLAYSSRKLMGRALVLDSKVRGPFFRFTGPRSARPLLKVWQYDENPELWEAYYSASIADAVEVGALLVNKSRTAMRIFCKPNTKLQMMNPES